MYAARTRPLQEYELHRRRCCYVACLSYKELAEKYLSLETRRRESTIHSFRR